MLAHSPAHRKENFKTLTLSFSAENVLRPNSETFLARDIRQAWDSKNNNNKTDCAHLQGPHPLLSLRSLTD